MLAQRRSGALVYIMASLMIRIAWNPARRELLTLGATDSNGGSIDVSYGRSNMDQPTINHVTRMDTIGLWLRVSLV